METGDYLRRLGLRDLGAPSVEGLRAVHAAQVERVPYECLEIWLGRPTTVDPAESVARILRGRGGYCFHLNGALSVLLRALGYRVTRHVGGVQGAAGNPPGASANHLALTVSGLPSAESPEGGWLVDAGLGDALHLPLPLVEGTYRQGPFTYRLRPSEAEPGGWRFEHDRRGSFLGMDFRPEEAPMSAFHAQHERLSTSPESGFVQVATVLRRDSTGVDALRGLVLSRIGVETTSATVSTVTDYFDVLADIFGITLDDVGPAERAKLWDRLSRAHERWLAETAGG